MLVKAAIAKRSAQGLLKAEETKLKSSKYKPSKETLYWERDNWNAEDGFWRMFDELVTLIRNDSDRGEPVWRIIFPTETGFRIKKDWWQKYKPVFDANSEVILSFPFLSGADAIYRFVPKTMAPYTSSAGYYDNPADFPGPIKSLYDRRRIFYLRALCGVIPKTKYIVLDREAVEVLGLQDEKVDELFSLE